MKTFYYYLKQVFLEFKNRPSSHLFSVGTVSLTLVLAGLLFLVSDVLKYASKNWGSGATFAVYISQNSSGDKIKEIKRELAGLNGIESIKTISSSTARKRLIRALKNDAKLIKNVERSFFPVSLEIVVRGSSATVQSTQKKLMKLSGIIKGIEDIKSVNSWNRKIGYIIDIMMFIGIVILALVLFASGYVIMTTTRLSIENKLEELKIIKFLGATKSFIHIPVLLEGMIQGLLGAGIAFGILFGISFFIFPFLQALVGNTLPSGGILVFFSVSQLAIGTAFSVITGLVAGKLALSTIKV